jgi:hypothetical protein
MRRRAILLGAGADRPRSPNSSGLGPGQVIGHRLHGLCCGGRQVYIVVIGTARRQVHSLSSTRPIRLRSEYWPAKRRAPQRSPARYADCGLAPPEAKNPAKSSGCVSKQRSPSGSVIHGCLLRVQICAVGFSHEVSSNVPARTERNIPPNLGLPVSHEPQSRHIHRVDTRAHCRLYSAPDVARRQSAENASSVTTKPIEKALLVIF